MGRGHDAPTDHALVAAVGGGSREALGELYRRYGGAVWSVAKRVCRRDDLAETVCQAVFAELWSSPRRFGPPRGALRSCLVAEAHTRAVDARGRDEAVDPAGAADPDPAALAEPPALSEEGRRAVERLPATERDTILLAYFGGRAYIDRTQLSAAGDTGAMAKSHIRQGLLNLRRALAAEGVTT